MSSPLLDLLTAGGHLTAAQRDQAVEEAARLNQLGATPPVQDVQAAVKLGMVSIARVREVVAAATGAQTSNDLTLERSDPAAVRLLPSSRARLWRVVPMRLEGDAVVIAATVATAANPEVLDNLRVALNGRPIKWVYATEQALTAKINAEYRAEAELTSLAERATESEADQGELATRFVRLVLNQAITDRASDIHVEPGEFEVAVRFRIDGVLVDKPNATKSMQNAVINQLKIMASLDIGDNRIPQDGRLTHELDGKVIDFRVAVLPTVWGEKIVMRILDNSAARRSLTDFGLSRHNEDRFRASFSKPHGLILVTGPTGSGKSTTLYATLNELNRPDVNIITVEDPVEYRLPRVNQVQVNKKAGMTFAAALRTILRADPDIVLIGEIRDQETAQIAIEAAQTGHLVLSTLHTNNAPESPSRLIEMGVEPFLVATVLECVVAQRLVRKLCAACKIPYTPTQDELAKAKFTLPPGAPGTATFFTKVGCNKCSHTGYRGRFAIQEVLTRSSALERAIAAGKETADLHDIAQQQGLVTLRQDGWLKVTQGETSIEEILRVVA